MQNKTDKFLNSIGKKLQVIGPLEFDKSKVSSSLPTVVIDGGLNHELSLENQLSIGDGDSAKGEHRIKIDIHLNKEKDYSDLGYLFNLLDETYLKNHLVTLEKLELWGFLGKRRDHEFINILEAYSFLKNRSQLVISFQEEILCLSKGDYEFDRRGTFSLISLEGTEVQIAGSVKYPFKGILKASSSHGLSNESQGSFQIKASGPLILFN